MSRRKTLGLAFLLTLALAAPPAHAAPAPRGLSFEKLAIAGWFDSAWARLVGLFAAPKHGGEIDPNGQPKHGGHIDPNGRPMPPEPDRSGTIDPDGDTPYTEPDRGGYIDPDGQP